MYPESDPDSPDETEHGPFTWIFVGVVVSLFLADILISNETVGIASLLFVPAWIVLTVIHEGAHALAARTLGWQVPMLEVGFGAVWRQFRWGNTEVYIRRYPIVGCVRVVPKHFRQPKLRNALIYAAGPLAEAGVLAVIIAVFGEDKLRQPEHLWSAVAAVIALAALISIAINLFPYRTENGAITDGLGILLSPTLTRVHFEHLYCEPIVERLVDRRAAGELELVATQLEALAQRFPNVILIRYEICCTLVLLDRRREALFDFQAYVSQLDSARKDEAQAFFERLRIFPKTLETPFSWEKH